MSKNFTASIIFFALFLFQSVSCFGQKTILERKITLTIQGESLQKALVIIGDKGKFNYSYNPAILQLDKIINYNARKKTIEEILTDIIDNPTIVIDEYKSQIIIRKVRLHEAKSLEIENKEVLQNRSLITISGKVIDSLTNKPISFAHVYIANTLMGTSTDSTGYFSIEKIPLKSFDLFVSHVSYKAVAQTIGPDDVGKECVIMLADKALNLDAVDVDANKSRDWKKYLKGFEKDFFGTSRNANKCKILNPWVLDFYENLDGTITAKASDLLIIENNALGYKVNYLLENFESGKNYVNYSGKSKFDYLDENDKKNMKRWKKNKLRAYKGSLMHFLYALRTKNLLKEGFLVRRAEFDTINRKHNTPMRYTNLNKLKEASLNSDSVYRLFHSINVTSSVLLLDVSYTKEREELQYSYWLREQHDVNSLDALKRSRTQSSRVSIRKIAIKGDNKNSSYSTFAVTVYGYWAWTGFAEALPISYQP